MTLYEFDQAYQAMLFRQWQAVKDKPNWKALRSSTAQRLLPFLLNTDGDGI